MIQITELRIGNFISPMGFSFTKVEGFDIYDDMILSSDFAERTNDYYEPIPLTEEWLLKFGFRHVKNNWYNIHAKGNTFNVYLFEDSSYRVEIVSQSLGIFKHVHTLQNLYFALSEKELVVSDAVS